jgi:hypothetical protein
MMKWGLCRWRAQCGAGALPARYNIENYDVEKRREHPDTSETPSRHEVTIFAFEFSVIRPPTCIHAMLKRLCLSVNQKPSSCGSPPLSDDLQKRLSKMFIYVY